MVRVNPATTQATRDTPHRIELNLRDVGQLFNTMDPSPFHERDLDHDAEEFIESWAHEFPAAEPLTLLVHLRDWPKDQDPKRLIELAIHNHFTNRARLNRIEFRQLMATGRRTLLIGLAFLSTCLFVAARFFPADETDTALSVLRESLTIGGWVAMWRPLEIYLYDWWPVRRQWRNYLKLSLMPVDVVART